MYRSRCRSESNSNSRPMLCCTCPCRSLQKLSFSSLTKCWNCSVMGVTFAMGVSLLARMASASQAKANLHPLVFYTIEVTSPEEAPSNHGTLHHSLANLVVVHRTPSRSNRGGRARPPDHFCRGSPRNQTRQYLTVRLHRPLWCESCAVDPDPRGDRGSLADLAAARQSRSGGPARRRPGPHRVRGLAAHCSR